MATTDWTKAGKRVGEWKQWEGGRARWDGLRWTFYVWRGDCRRSTGQHVHENALEHLRAFEANPESYHPDAVRKGPKPIFLTSEISVEWLDWMAAPQSKGGKGNGAEYLRNSKHYIQWWRDRLPGRDLRTLDVAELRLPATEPALPHKLRAIKCFFTWVRRHRPVPPGEVGVAGNEGPDTSALLLPQAKGHKLHHLDANKAKQRREKGIRALHGYFLVRESKQFSGEARQPYRDALDLLFCTGWHTTELVRWLELGSVIDDVQGRGKEGWGVLWTVHKSGQEFQIEVDPGARACAGRLRDWHKHERLLKEGVKFDHVPAFPVRFFVRLVHDTCAALNIVPKFGPGHLRHANATARALGKQDLVKIKEALGHAPGSTLAETTYIDPAAQVTRAVALPWGVGLKQLTKTKRGRAAPRTTRPAAATAG